MRWRAESEGIFSSLIPCRGSLVDPNAATCCQFFFVFVVWSVIFCLWTFTTLLALTVRAATRTGTNLDAQHIVVIAMCVFLRCRFYPAISWGLQIRSVLDIYVGHAHDAHRTYQYESDDGRAHLCPRYERSRECRIGRYALLLLLLVHSCPVLFPSVRVLTGPGWATT